MLVGIFTIIGAGVSALAGALISNSDIGQMMESALEDAADCIKRVIGKD